MGNAYQTAKSIQRLEQTLGSNRIRKARKVKQKTTWKQRFRQWLYSDNDDTSDIPQAIEADKLSSDGMRFHLYRASGGYVVETRQYDRKNDRSINNLYIINDGDDVGEKMGKIITMESLR
jgi:hypothetical protein